MLPGAQTILQDLDPSLVHALWRAGFTRVFDDALDQAADRRLPLIVGALPFLIDGAELMPIRTQRFRPVLGICRGAVRERDDPILKKVALRIGLDIDRHIFVVGGLAALGLEIVELSAVGTRKRCCAGGARLDRIRLCCCVHRFLLLKWLVSTSRFARSGDAAVTAGLA